MVVVNETTSNKMKQMIIPAALIIAAPLATTKLMTGSFWDVWKLSLPIAAEYVSRSFIERYLQSPYLRAAVSNMLIGGGIYALTRDVKLTLAGVAPSAVLSGTVALMYGERLRVIDLG